MLDRSLFSAEQLASAEVDPELMLIAVQLSAEGSRRKGRRGMDVVEACIRAYGEYIGIDAKPGEDAFTSDDILVILALASRMLALAEVLEQGHFVEATATQDEGAELTRAAVIEAACSATLLEKDGKPRFQLLDFLARVERAMADAK